MRYYAIKISGGSSGSTAGNTSGSAALPVASNGRVAGPVSSGTRFTQSLGLNETVVDTPSGGVSFTLPTFNVTPSPAPDYTTPNVPSSIQAISGASVSGAQFTSVVNGQNDPGALDIEFDVQRAQGMQNNNNHIKIKGVTPQMISQATNLNQCRLQMWVGFTEGLPLATDQVPHQGLILDGEIWPAFGNWIYNELSLELFVVANTAGMGGPTNVKNIVHNMPAGQPLSTALQNTLQTAFPKAQIVMNISDKLKLNYPDWGIYEGLEQLSAYVKALSHSILGTPPQYKGVRISSNGNTITVDDGTKPGSAIQINYQDLIGQPTWIENNTIQVRTAMRGDVGITSQITLPPTLITQTAGGAVARMASDINSEYGPGVNNLLFSGTWEVTGIRHIGKFRDPGMDSWITVINAVTNSTGTNTTTTAPNDAPGGPDNQSGFQAFNPPSGAAPGSSGGIGMA